MILQLVRKLDGVSISGSVVHPASITFSSLLNEAGFRVNALFNKTDDCKGLKCLFLVNTTQQEIESLNSELRDVEMSNNWEVYGSATINAHDEDYDLAYIDTPNDLGRFGVSAFCPKTHLTEKEEGEIL